MCYLETSCPLTMSQERIDFSQFRSGSKVTLSSSMPFLRNRKGWIGDITDEHIEFHELKNEPLIFSNGENPRYLRHIILLDSVTEIESRSGKF
jgi:hypothetical protein